MNILNETQKNVENMPLCTQGRAAVSFWPHHLQICMCQLGTGAFILQHSQLCLFHAYIYVLVFCIDA